MRGADARRASLRMVLVQTETYVVCPYTPMATETAMSGRVKSPRRSPRLRGYDYSQAGAYFVTICTYRRQELFGHVVDEQIVLNHFGRVVHDEWVRSEDIREEIEIDAFVVMPNHVHGIVLIHSHDTQHIAQGPVGTHGGASVRRPPRSLGSCIAGFKSAVTQRINALRDTPSWPVWQERYYDHIIRNAHDLDVRRQYIANNPARWIEDTENPANH